MTFHFLKDLFQGPGRAIRQRTFSLRRGGCHEQQAHLVRGIITVGQGSSRSRSGRSESLFPEISLGKHPHGLECCGTPDVESAVCELLFFAFFWELSLGSFDLAGLVLPFASHGEPYPDDLLLDR